MSALFTDTIAAIEEGDFIANDIKKTAYMVVDEARNLYVISDDQYALEKWKNHTVIEIFRSPRRVP
jgi:hypothetical protein|tara:strand:- start:2051 stop:2248 length:198 start_codon:yes stop_codon:yes gene_type:complete